MLSIYYPLFQRRWDARLPDRTEYSINKNILGDVFEADMVLTQYQMEDVIETFRARVEGGYKISLINNQSLLTSYFFRTLIFFSDPYIFSDPYTEIEPETEI